MTRQVGPLATLAAVNTGAGVAAPAIGTAPTVAAPVGAELSEFSLIARFFTRPVTERRGIGDDCALIDVGDRTLALTTDMLVEGTHFFAGTDPAALGHKALAVNLSDLAAAGATPRCFLLSLGLPSPDPAWLGAFADGLFALADVHGCSLVGGDTTRMPVPLDRLPRDVRSERRAMSAGRVISITALGELPRGAIRTRAGAMAGDDIWVSGTLGDAALAVAARTQRWEDWPGETPPCDALARDRLERPEPRVALGLALRGLVTAAIDLSDGLAGDLRHILHCSKVGARVDVDAVPCRSLLRSLPLARWLDLVLAGGDDYELLFTAQPELHDIVLAMAADCGVAVTRIGRITAGTDLVWHDRSGNPVAGPQQGFDHFAREGA